MSMAMTCQRNDPVGICIDWIEDNFYTKDFMLFFNYIAQWPPFF